LGKGGGIRRAHPRALPSFYPPLKEKVREQEERKEPGLILRTASRGRKKGEEKRKERRIAPFGACGAGARKGRLRGRGGCR